VIAVASLPGWKKDAYPKKDPPRIGSSLPFNAILAAIASPCVALSEPERRTRERSLLKATRAVSKKEFWNLRPPKDDISTTLVLNPIMAYATPFDPVNYMS
jgi:hypothetical protein